MMPSSCSAAKLCWAGILRQPHFFGVGEMGEEVQRLIQRGKQVDLRATRGRQERQGESKVLQMTELIIECDCHHLASAAATLIWEDFT